MSRPELEMSATLPIHRYRTAIRRHRGSKPIALAVGEGLIDRQSTVFDYGCGHGGDIRFLRERGIKADGWDPHYRPNAKLSEADVVNLGYVLNVIEDLGERTEALRRAYSLARRLLMVAVRIDRDLGSGKDFADGRITGRGTFQRLYTQAEFQEYLQSVLHVSAITAAPGIAYVFADDDSKARYLANRAFTQRLEYRSELIEEFSKHPLARRYVRLGLKLGRAPLPEEFPLYAKLLESFGSRSRLERLLLQRVDRRAFEGSREERRADILTYFAMLRLEGLHPPPIGSVPPTIQADIRAFWGRYSAAVADGDRLLFSIGQPALVRAAAESSRVGKLLPEDFYVHRSAVDELPAMLRLVAFAATKVVGSVTYDVMKMSLDGKSVSFLSYADFDEEPHPALSRSLRVYLPKAAYTVREYGNSDNPPILHRKDTLVTESYPLYAIFRRATEAEDALGLLSASNIGYRKSWEELLKSRGLALCGYELVRDP